MNPSRLEALRWGDGPCRVELFVEPTCPFSARAYAKLDELLELDGSRRLSIHLRLLSQPWHQFSPLVTRAVLAASAGAGGRQAARRVLSAVFAHREEFVLVDHCAGPLLDRSPRQTLARIEQLAGLDLAEAFADPRVTVEMKWQARYARQNGIHVTPTVMVDGLVAAEMSSKDSAQTWMAQIAERAAA
jgi:protein-disulfide isomerase